MTSKHPPMGFSGRLASFFIRSKLSILLILVPVMLGVMAIKSTPKEDEPSITVCLADVFIAYPGRGEKEIDERIARPVDSWIREIPSVEHVSSSAGPDGAMFIVQFRAGVPRERALVLLNDRLQANLDQLPPGVPPPLVKPRGLEDVPDLNAVLSSSTEDPQTLRRLAGELASDLRRLSNVARVEITGGSPRTIRVELDAKRMAERGLGAEHIVQAIHAANLLLPGGSISGPEGNMRVEAGAFLKSAEDVGALIVGANGAGPIYLRDVAHVVEGSADPTDYVSHFSYDNHWSSNPAVTLMVTKLKGSNATAVTKQVRTTLDSYAKEMLPSDVRLTYVRDSGRTAGETVEMSIDHVVIAVVVATLLVIISLGWREGLVTAIVLPVTLFSIPITYYFTGFTLNRITLAAMVFAIGLLIDNAIVVIENIHRHYHTKEQGEKGSIAAKATQEIGSPTILATIMVVIALVPTAFLTGMAGQYLRALPIGASIGMACSLFLALTVVPYLCSKLLSRQQTHSPNAERKGRPRKRIVAARYQLLLTWVFARPARMLGVYAFAFLLLAGSLAMLPTRLALFQLLGGKDQEELSIMIDLPAGDTLESANAAVTDVARTLKNIPEIQSCQTYVGIPGPLTFQGVARHYNMRTQEYQAEIQIELKPESERKRTSHDVSLAVRNLVAPMLHNLKATSTVAEIPSGVPVIAPLVAEIYAPDEGSRLMLAQRVKTIFESMPGVTDIDWTARPGAKVARLEIEHQQAAVRGVVAAQAALSTRVLFAGDSSSWAQVPREHEPVQIVIRQSPSHRADLNDLASLYLTSVGGGPPVPASEISKTQVLDGTYPLWRMDIQPVVMVTAVITGDGPLYTALDVAKRLHKETDAGPSPVQVLFSDAVPDPQRQVVKWTGDWNTQRDVLRDLGGAFAIVLCLIYVMLVAWYESFLMPIVIMLPIPLILVGVIPAHALIGKYIDGPGLIGVIALAGIMVRNSILLVDFALEKLAEGVSIREAVLRASRTRMRPIILTAMAVILGENVLIFDPLLQGLGYVLVFGCFVSTALTLGIIPIALYQLETFLHRQRRHSDDKEFEVLS
jgi:multidrug efflux pump subunit AcrB